MFRKCPKFGAMSDARAEELIAAVDDFVLETRQSGIVSESQMDERLGELAPTEMRKMEEKVVNQQRTLFLNGPGVLRLREDRNEKKRRAGASGGKKVVIPIDPAALVGIAGPPGRDAFCESPSCTKRVSGAKEGSEWRRCSTCEKWYCKLVNCQKNLKKHAPICASRAAPALKP